MSRESILFFVNRCQSYLSAKNRNLQDTDYQHYPQSILVHVLPSWLWEIRMYNPLNLCWTLDAIQRVANNTAQTAVCMQPLQTPKGFADVQSQEKISTKIA